MRPPGSLGWIGLVVLLALVGCTEAGEEWGPGDDDDGADDDAADDDAAAGDPSLAPTSPQALACDGPALHVPEEYATIHEAVAAAVSGDVICIGPGTYDANVDLDGKAVWLIGTGGIAETVIRGEGYGQEFGIRIRNVPGEVRIQGLTITHADRGAIVAEDADVRLDHLQLLDSSGGVRAQGSTVRIDDCFIARNHQTMGGGISATTSMVTVRNTWLEQNRVHSWDSVVPECGRGGGLYAYQSLVDLENVVLVGNEIDDELTGQSCLGGGMLLRESGARVAQTAFVGNRGPLDTPHAGGGGLEVLSSELLGENLVFVGNQSQADGAIGVGAWSTNLPSAGELAYAALWDNHPDDGDTDPLALVGIVHEDPSFMDTEPPDAPELWDLHLTLDSPLIDAGDPTVLDPDGSPADLGPFGGPGAASWDLDHDGYPAWWHPGPYDPAVDPGEGWDCDDRDPGVYPGNGC